MYGILHLKYYHVLLWFKRYKIKRLYEMKILYFKIDDRSPLAGTTALYSFGVEVAIRPVGQLF